jgi:hypothetical protein
MAITKKNKKKIREYAERIDEATLRSWKLRINTGDKTRMMDELKLGRATITAAIKHGVASPSVFAKISAWIDKKYPVAPIIEPAKMAAA